MDQSTSSTSKDESGTSYSDTSNSQHLYSNSELLSQLSVIPEERSEDDDKDEEKEGAALFRQAGCTQQGEEEEKEKEENGLPWYQQDTSSLDAWQTTPPYRSDDVIPMRTPAKFLPSKQNLKKVTVTEEMIPRLQVGGEH